MINGYVTIDLASNNIYKEALGAIKAQKPVMVVDVPQVYFADTIKTVTVSDDVVVQITKGGKTITINDVNAVSSEGDIQEKMIVLDLTSYDLTSYVSSIDDIVNATEISQETFTNLVNIVKKAKEESKPLYYKTSGLYDSENMKGLFVATNYLLDDENKCLLIPYVDIADDNLSYITIGLASDDKYYIFAGTNWIY